MKKAVVIFLLAAALALLSCDRTPRGVIGEKEMARLIADLNKADALVMMYPDQFPTDSAKLVLRQSIFKQHGITSDDYERSIDWYSHNVDVYIQVNQKAIELLQEEEKKSGGKAAPAAKPQQGGVSTHRTYPSQGDTADLWDNNRQWMLTPSMARGFIEFDIAPDAEARSGDRYMLEMKNLAAGCRLRVFLAADYSDGGTVYTQRNSVNDGWAQFTLQTDTARNVTRIYGYVNYIMKPGSYAYVDSLALIRTHFDPKSYSAITINKRLERDAARREPARQQSPKSEGSFAPKPGVNKSSVSRHVTSSPNASHLPK